MNITRFLNQQVSWQAQSDETTRGDRVYADATTIAGRFSPMLRDIIGADGETTTVTTKFLLLVQPTIGDLLEGREVVAVDAIVDISGATLGYTVLTR